MKTNPLKEGALTENSVGLGTVTRKMVLERAVEHARIDGRAAHEVSPADWAQSRRELTGQPAPDSNETILEAAPESHRWNPIPGSPGHRKAVTGSEDEDAEGRSDRQQLTDEGLGEAEHDQRLQASQAAVQ